MSGVHPLAVNDEEEEDDSDELVFDASRVNEISRNAREFPMMTFGSIADMVTTGHPNHHHHHQSPLADPEMAVEDVMKQFNLPSFARVTSIDSSSTPVESTKKNSMQGPSERRDAFLKRFEEKTAVLMEELNVDKHTAKKLLVRSDCSLNDANDLFYDVRYDNLQDDRAVLMNTLVQVEGRIERVRQDPEVHTLERFCDDMRNKAKDRVASLERLLKLLRMHLLIDNTGARSTTETLSATVLHANTLRRKPDADAAPQFKPEEIFELVEGGTYDTRAKSVSGVKQQASSEIRRSIAQKSFERDAERIIAQSKAKRKNARRRKKK
jgi:hypothetical protein